MTDKEVQEAVARADAEYDMLKDRVHEQYDEIERLNKELDKTRISELEKEYRISEAIEYIEQLTNDEESIELMDINSLVQEELLNILKGVDKE